MIVDRLAHYNCYPFSKAWQLAFDFLLSLKPDAEEKKCGDLAHGFARVRCPDCRHEFLFAFSCRGRWFCPSCHTKKVVQFGELLRENMIYMVPPPAAYLLHSNPAPQILSIQLQVPV